MRSHKTTTVRSLEDMALSLDRYAVNLDELEDTTAEDITRTIEAACMTEREREAIMHGLYW